MKKFLKRLGKKFLTLLLLAFFAAFIYSVWKSDFIPRDLWGNIIRIGLCYIILTMNMVLKKVYNLSVTVGFIRSDVIYRLSQIKKGHN